MTVVQIVFCTFLLSTSILHLFIGGEQLQQGMNDLKQQYYELNFDKLRDVWYTGMMRGVLKAKAKNLCENLSQNECVLYSLCTSDAQTLVELAKCVVTLLDERDRQIAINEEHRQQLQAGITPVESQIFSRFPSFEYMNKELRTMLAKLETSFGASTQQQQQSIHLSSNEPENRSIIMKPLPIQSQPNEIMITPYKGSTVSSYMNNEIPAMFQRVNESFLQVYPSSFNQLLATSISDQNDTGDQSISVEGKALPVKVPVKAEFYKEDIDATSIRSNYSTSLINSKLMGNNRKKDQQIIRSQNRRDHKNNYNKRPGKDRYRTIERNSSEQQVDSGGISGDAFKQENLHRLQGGNTKHDEQKAAIPIEVLLTKMRSIKIAWPEMRNETDSTSRNLKKRSEVHSGISVMNRKKRRRRSSPASTNKINEGNKGMGKSRQSSKKRSNVEKLMIIRDHFSRVAQINAYMKRMNQENSRFLHEINVQVESRFETIEDANQNEMLNDIVDMINAFQKTGKDGPSISIMSPRLFSIVPEASRRPQLLSPTLLSFQKDGFFSVPDLLNMATNRKSDASQLVDLVVELSGAATILNKLYETLQPQIKQVNEVQLPAIREFQRQEENWQNVIDSYSEKQKLDLKKRGYAHLEPKQLQLIYDKPIGVLRGIDLNWTQYANMNETQREERLEANIRQLAMLDEKISKPIGRYKRDDEFESAEFIELEEEHGPTYRTLSPYAFTNRIGQGLALEAVTLSPHAFIPEILFPEGLVLYTLSPRAFIGSVLSPQALIGRIISPSALRGDVMSPRALVAHVISPEALIAEVLTPRFIEPRIISPELLVFYLLSPEFLAPYVLSDETLGVFILSPHVLSPRLWSHHHMVVEILSPEILSGSYPESEEEHEGDEIVGFAKPKEAIENL